MKALTKYAALALVAGLWSCTSSKLAQQPQGEYDDLYFTSKDREQALTASASSSTLQYDKMDRAEDASTQQNANPDYVAADNRRQNNRNADAYNAGDTYYDESYADRRRFGSIRPSVAGGVYSSPAYYDPFFSPYGYDSFYARNAYSSFYYDPFFSNRPYWGFRPGVSISISYNTWGRPWGWNSWGYDPYWNAGPWGYNAWNSWGYDPFWGGGYAYGPGYNNFYGGGWGWNRPWYGGNTVIVGNGGNGGRDNTVYRNYGRRGEGRGSEVISDQNNGAPTRGNAPARGGRLDGSGDVNRNPDATAYPGYTRPQRGSAPDRNGYDPGQNNGGRTSSPDVITTRPAGSGTNDGYSRPTRPRSSDYNTGNTNQRSSTYYNNDNNSARPTYSAPRNDSWGGGNNGGGNSGSGYSRPSRSDNGSFGGSSPAPAPSGGRSSGYSGGSNSGGSSSGSSGSSGGYSRPPRN